MVFPCHQVPSRMRPSLLLKSLTRFSGVSCMHGAELVYVALFAGPGEKREKVN